MKRYFKHIATGIVLLLLFAGLLTNCMLQNIKDTDSILHEDYKQFSLVHGAIAWETGVIRRLYDFGQIFPTYKEDKQGRKIIENYEKPEQSSKLVRLIHALFYRVPGSTGEADFGVTTQLAKDNPADVVNLIAQIMLQCEQLRQQQEQFKQALDYVQDLIALIADVGWLEMLGKKVTRNNLEQKIKDVQEKPWNVNVSTAFVSMCQSFANNLAKELGGDIVQKLDKHQQAAEKYFGTIADVTKKLRELFKPEVFKKRESVESFIVGALNEADQNNIDALYPPHTVEMVFLAFLYKKYSNDRTVLKAFYDALNTQFGGKILAHDLDEQWVKDKFEPVTQAQAFKQIETIFSAQDLMKSIKQHYAEFVYDAFQIRAFPAPVGYATAFYEYEKGKKTVGVADCMDNTMRNFINLYAYNAEQNKFTLEKLLTTMGIKVVHPLLAQFLKNFDSVNVASSSQAHNAWLQVISNIPYVAYNQMVDGASGQSTNALDTGKGYIAVSENELNENLLGWLKNSGYQVLEKNQYGYELQPSVKNIIIVLDHLLQLNLFGDADGLSKEFMRPDFIKEYFPKFCVAVKATGFLSTQGDAKQGQLDKDFDALDYAATKIFTTIDLVNIVCKFATFAGHGELKLLSAPGGQGLDLLQNITNFSGKPSLSLLVTNVLCRQWISFYHLENNLNYLYSNLFAVPLENTGLLDSMVDRTYSVMTTAVIPLKIKIFIKDFFMRLVERQPDEIVRQMIRLKIIRLVIEGEDESEIKVNNILKEAINFAAKGVIDKNMFVKVNALGVFNALVKKGKGFTEAVDAATKGIIDQEFGIRKWAYDLFVVLVEKSPNETKQAVQKLLNNPNVKLPEVERKKLSVLLEQ